MAPTFTRTLRHLLETLPVYHLRFQRRTAEATTLEVAANNNNNGLSQNTLGKPATDILSTGLIDRRSDGISDRLSSAHIPIPQPTGLPVVGNIADFLSSFGGTAHTFLQKRAREMGPIYQFSSFGQRMVFLFNYDDIDILRKAEGNFPEHIEFRHLKKYREKNELPLGVLISTGEDWANQRRMLSGSMLRPESLSKYFRGLHEVAREAVLYHVTSLERSRSCEIENLTGKFALEGIGRSLLGTRLGCFDDKDPEYLRRFVYLARRNFQDAKQLLIAPECVWQFLPAWRRHNEGWNYILDVARHHVNKQLAQWVTEDIIPDECILGMLHKSSNMSRTELHVNVADLLLAAIDTTSSAILWALYELSRHPDVQEQILREFFSNQGREPLAYKHLQSLTYLRAVLKETLRLHPVAFFSSRITERETIIQGYVIPKQTHVACSMYVMGRDKNLFSEPERFKPERWLQLGDRNHGGAFYAKVPFGSGIRMCLGRISTALLSGAVSPRRLAEDTQHAPSPSHIILTPQKPVDDLTLLLSVKQSSGRLFGLTLLRLEPQPRSRRIAETEILLFLLEMCKTFTIQAESTIPVEPTFRILMVPKTKLQLKFIPRK